MEKDFIIKENSENISGSGKNDAKFDQNNPFLAPLQRNERQTPADHFQVGYLL